MFVTDLKSTIHAWSMNAAPPQKAQSARPRQLLHEPIGAPPPKSKPKIQKKNKAMAKPPTKKVVLKPMPKAPRRSNPSTVWVPAKAMPAKKSLLMSKAAAKAKAKLSKKNPKAPERFVKAGDS